MNIDKLEIEVAAKSESAEKKIDNLIKKLSSLTAAVSKTTGLNRIAKQLDKIATATARITNIPALDKLTTSLAKLNSLQAPNVTKTVNAINKLVSASNSIGSLGNISQLSTNIQEIATACKPLETMGKNTLAPFLNSLKKIPEITNTLDTQKIKEFAERIKQITSAITPLTTAVTKAESGLVALNGVISSTVAKNGNLASSNAAATKTFTSYGSVITAARLKMAALVAVAYKLKNVLIDCLDSSNEYVENLNLFTVSMGDAAKGAFEYAQEVNAALGIDVSDWIRNQGVFKQITSGFGVITEKANLMSKNLTQIGYDISSFYNIGIEESMQKVQSGISGELEPLRRLGYALDVATLQQIAYDNGITQSINTMTQAQKSQLRYIAILQQSKNVMGDMARTIVTPANSMRILGQQFTQLQRAIGNIVSVLAMKLIPYVQVAIRLLTDFANFLAEKMGFELPTIDYSSTTDGISSVTDTADDATDAVNETVKAVQRLAGFDEINTLKSPDSNDSGSNGIGNNFDLGVDLPEYDFLKGLDKQTDKLYKDIKKKLKDIYKRLKEHKELVKTIAVIIAGIWTAAKIGSFIGKLKNVTSLFSQMKWITKLGSFGSVLTSALSGIAGGVAGFFSMKDMIDGLYDGTAKWNDVLLDASIAVGGIALAFAVGGPIAGGIAIVGTLAGAFYSLYVNGEKVRQMATGFYDNSGVKISDITQLLVDNAQQYVNTAKKVEDFKKTISDNDGTIATAATKIQNFNKEFSATSDAKMTAEDLQSIQTQNETIAKSVSDNLGLATQSVVEGFSKNITEMAKQLGIDLDGVISDLKGMANELSTNLGDYANADSEYWEAIYKGETPTDDLIEKHKAYNKYITDKAKESSTELNNFKQVVSDSLDFSKIDFQNPEILDEQMKKLNDSYQDGMNAVNTIFMDNKANLDKMLSEATYQFNAGMMDSETYENCKKAYSETLNALKTDRDLSLKDLGDNLSAVTGALQSQLNNKLKELATIATDTYFITDGNVSADKLAEWKKKHQAMYDEMFDVYYGQAAAKKEYAEVQKAIDAGTAGLDVSIDVKAGDAFVRNMNEFCRVGIPTELAKLKTVCEGFKTVGATIPDSINTGYMSKAGEVFGSVKKDISTSLSFDLSSEGTKAGETYADSFDKSMSATTDTFNKVLSNQGAFSVESLNAFNEYVPSLNEALNAMGRMAGLQFNIPTISYTAKSHSVPGFANGGFPQKSQLFMARENGIPEMVGKMGNQTAVANNGQIVEGIEAGVERGVMRAMAGNNNTPDINVYAYVDSDELATKVEQRQNIKNKRTGGR